MKIYRLSKNPIISINVETTNSHHNQTDYLMTANLNNLVVATLEFSVYQDEPYVNMIKVEEKYQRQGIATQLLRKLQEMYPETEIHMGMSSQEGSELLKSIPTKFIPNERHIELTKKRNNLKENLDKLQHFLDSANPKTQREEMLSQGEKWNQIHDQLYEIEKELENMKSGKTIIL